MLPSAGEHFGPYEILAELGGGGMGVVYRAWDERLHREVAVKVLREDFQAPNMRRRFLLEARAASALSHPHICTVFDLGEQNGEPFLVMELLQGQTLRDRIAQQACTAEEIVCWGEQIADALAAAHEKGIVHRDIKPANIFLQQTPSGQPQVKVLDFGLAKISMTLRSGRDSRALEATTAGFTVGTLAYMSPEQARGEALDLRSDLFSLGAVLYEMATRRAPFRAATTALVFQALLSRDPEPMRTWNASLPRELERIILQLLQKDRTRRFSAAPELQEALDQLARRGEGDWLRKIPRPTIPLVVAADPVLRRRREKSSRPPGAAPVSTSTRVPILATDSAARAASGDAHLIRPLRLPQRESRPRETRFATLAVLPESSPEVALFDEPRAVAVEQNGSAWVADPPEPFTQSAALAGPSAAPGEAPMPASDLENAGSPEAVEEGVTTPTAAEVKGQSGRERRAPVIPPALFSDPPSHRHRHSGQQPTAESPGSLSRPRLGRTRAWWIAGGAALAVFLLILLLELTTGSLNQVVLGPSDTLLLGGVENQTTDPSLSPAVEEALELALTRNSRLHWLGAPAESAALHQLGAESASARAEAHIVQSRAYLFSSLTPHGEGYLLRLDLVESESNDRLASVTAEAASPGDLLAATGVAASHLLQRLGEAPGTGNPKLQTEIGTADLVALALYRQAELAALNLDLPRATALFQQSAEHAPAFAAPRLRLAWIDDQQGAEVAAADDAERAVSAAARGDRRTQLLARATSEALALHEPDRAAETARELAAQFPADPEPLLLLARSMRRGGHMAEALLSAEQTYRQHPFQPAGYQEAALAKIGLERPWDTQKIAALAASHGVRCECAGDLASYLLKGVPPVAPTNDAAARSRQALLLDDAGQLAAAAPLWQRTADELRSDPRLISAAAGMLAQAALDRGLAGSCAEAGPFAQGASRLAFGRRAAFSLALEEILCNRGGSQLAADATNRLLGGANAEATPATALAGLLSGARFLAGRQAAQAAAVLSRPASERDARPLAVYLQALARQSNAQESLAAAGFQEVTRHHGYALLTQSTVASLAQRHLTHSAH